jgi:hypothetical protein
MRKNEPNEKSAVSKEQSQCISNQDAATSTTSIPLSRRSFFGRVGASTAVAAATGVGLPSFLLSQKAKADHDGDGDADADDASSRRARSFEIRVRAASADRHVHSPKQISNGDEERYSKFIGNYSQGLPHNSLGEVDPSAYRALLTAVDSGKPNDFANIPLGGNTKLSGPQGGLAFDLEGSDVAQLTIPPAPKLASAERAGEMVEDYWMAITRDIPFSQYGEEPLSAAAIVELNKMSDFAGPKVNGKITAATLFRGIRPGDLTGPYLSQFFLLPVTFGTLSIAQKFNTYAAGTDYSTSYSSWLAVLNGQGLSRRTPFRARATSRTVAIWVLGYIRISHSRPTCSRHNGCSPTEPL